jgi:DNA-binding NarL/FixJ family response regulator
MAMIRVVLADDDAIIVEGLCTILGAHGGIEVVATAVNGAQAVDRCREFKPAVAVLDIRMPVMDGIQAAAVLLTEKLAAPLLLTTFDEPDLIGRALDVGARGYILKNSPVEQIGAAIVTVAQGGTVFAPDIIDYIRSVVHIPTATAFACLTQRELEVVALVAQGLSNTQIAQRLYLSNGTVRNHISAILEKTGLEHRTQIAVRYYAKG